MSEYKKETSNFWTAERREELATAHQRLVDAVLHGNRPDQLEQVWKHFKLLPDSLVHYGCGITDRLIKGYQAQWLLLPYQTGYNLVNISDPKEGRSVEENIIDLSMPDSRPQHSFFGINTIDENTGGRLFITQTPLECLLLWNILGKFGSDDVISYLLPFQSFPTPKQSVFLDENSDRRIYVFQDHGNQLWPELHLICGRGCRSVDYRH